VWWLELFITVWYGTNFFYLFRLSGPIEAERIPSARLGTWVFNGTESKWIQLVGTPG